MSATGRDATYECDPAATHAEPARGRVGANDRSAYGGLTFELRRRGGATVRRAKSSLRDVLLRGTESPGTTTVREDLARQYLRGDGIEIGALHRPLRVPPGVRVRYVDLADRDALLQMYTSATYGNPEWVVETDVVDDCERLGSFADGSLDFVIANHIIEHTEDPIADLSP